MLLHLRLQRTQERLPADSELQEWMPLDYHAAIRHSVLIQTDKPQSSIKALFQCVPSLSVAALPLQLAEYDGRLEVVTLAADVVFVFCSAGAFSCDSASFQPWVSSMIQHVFIYLALFDINRGNVQTDVS